MKRALAERAKQSVGREVKHPKVDDHHPPAQQPHHQQLPTRRHSSPSSSAAPPLPNNTTSAAPGTGIATSNSNNADEDIATLNASEFMDHHHQQQKQPPPNLLVRTGSGRSSLLISRKSPAVLLSSSAAAGGDEQQQQQVIADEQEGTIQAGENSAVGGGAGAGASSSPTSSPPLKIARINSGSAISHLDATAATHLNAMTAQSSFTNDGADRGVPGQDPLPRQNVADADDSGVFGTGALAEGSDGGPSSQQQQQSHLSSSEVIASDYVIPPPSATAETGSNVRPSSAHRSDSAAGPPPPPEETTSSTSSPPLIRRRPSPTVTSSSLAATAGTNSSAAARGGGGADRRNHKAGQKRQRSSTGGGGTDNDNDQDLRDVPDDASAFYLRHQNRALAVEWQSLHSQVQQLTRERDERRQDCWAATQALQSLQATWTQLESAVVMLGTTSSSAAALSSTSAKSPPPPPATSPSSGGGAVLQSAVPSTGAGESVEWTRALSDALESLAANGSQSQQAKAHQQHLESYSAGGGGGRNGGGTAAFGSGARATAPGLEDEGGSLRSDWSSQCAASLATRAAVLQEHLLPRLLLSATTAASSQQGVGNSSSEPSDTTTDTTTKLLEENVKLQQQVHENASRCQLLERHVSELAQSRDEAMQSDRRIRRNVLRLNAGMMTTEQVVQAMEKFDASGHNHSEDNEEEFRELLNQVKEQQTLLQSMRDAKSSSAATGGSGDGLVNVKLEGDGMEGAGVASPGTADGALSASQQHEFQDLKAKVSDLEKAVSNRDESLQKLDAELKEKEKRISELSVKQRSDEDDKKLERYEALTKRLELAHGTVAKLEGNVEAANTRWATARSNEETVTETLREQHSKYEKRWTELGEALLAISGVGQDKSESLTPGEGERTDSTEAGPGSKKTVDDDKPNDGDDKAAAEVQQLLDSSVLGQAKRIAELQHKLDQALENVRQAEMTRMQLKESLGMNESLQSKLEEVKSKYSTLRSAAGSSSSAPSSSKTQQSSVADVDGSSIRESGTSGGTTNATSSSSSSSDRVEKLHRENRRMRKEMSSIVASKEAAKAKLERAEKERDSLVESNTRLLKQITEKDDMNAKSLSTILHLKRLTEQLTLERDNLDQQAKSASQLALAARLASNAKEKLSDEVLKEKEALEMRVKDAESKFESTKAQLDKITLEWSEASAKTTTLNRELSNALKRIDELVSDLEKKNGEVRKLTDAVCTAERQARESRDRAEALSKRRRASGTGANASLDVDASGFTVEQLSTQVSVLKNRLACPVCHYRDKECIIMRCRHMHCKQCVEERITNRSRKCPTCNNRFSDKDVEDIWLK